MALRASGRGLLRRHAPALREDEGLAGRANILGRGHWNEVRSDTQRGDYKAHAKEQEKRHWLPIHYALPIERPRKPEMTDRQNRTRQQPYHTAAAVRDPAQRRVERKKGALSYRYPTASAVRLTGVLGMLEEDDYHTTCERRGPGCSSGTPFYVTHRTITRTSEI